VKVDLSKICAFYLKQEDEDSRNLMEELRQERRDNEARDAQVSKEFKTLERALGLIQQKIARSELSDEQQKILIEDIDVAITRFEKLLLLSKEGAGKK
jgi:hypothetical protein